MDIVWSVDALIDLENIRRFLAEGEHSDPLKALEVCHFLYSYPEQEINLLPDVSSPKRGRPGQHPATHELPVPRYSNYIITYIPHDNHIEIVAVRDCRRAPGIRPGS